MNVKISKSEICGRVRIPLSKSVEHRLMIASALAGGKPVCENGGRDMLATAKCLEIMLPHIRKFLSARENGGYCDLLNSGEDLPHLNTDESGSTLRFLLPIAGAIGFECIFEGEGRLADRPLLGLSGVLVKHGCKLEQLGEKQLPLKIGGRLSAGEYTVDGSVSSQYITGLLFALPLLDGNSKLVVLNGGVSQSYIDITLGVLADFGIEIAKTPYGYDVKGNQHYVIPDGVHSEGDWSSACFMLALGALAGNVRVEGLNKKSLQGDREIVSLLSRAGVNIGCDGRDVFATKSNILAIDFDAQDCPDIVPIMAALLSFADGVSHIRHVDRLRDKECDRLSAIRDMFADFGIRTEYDDDTLTVYGGEHKPCTTHGFGDHRMAMSAMVCALCTDGESIVEGVECISKSYPTFIEHAVALGAKIEEIK